MAILAASAVRRSMNAPDVEVLATHIDWRHRLSQKRCVTYVTESRIVRQRLPTAAWVGPKFPDGALPAAGMIVR